jgi:hypothetical protein
MEIMHACMLQIAIAFAGTDVTEVPASVREVVDKGLSNDVLTDIQVRPVIFDEMDRVQDGQPKGAMFGLTMGTTDENLVVRTYFVFACFAFHVLLFFLPFHWMLPFMHSIG